MALFQVVYIEYMEYLLDSWYYVDFYIIYILVVLVLVLEAN